MLLFVKHASRPALIATTPTANVKPAQPVTGWLTGAALPVPPAPTLTALRPVKTALLVAILALT